MFPKNSLKIYSSFLLILLLLGIFIKDPYILHILNMIFIYSILSLGWNLQAGYTGQLNLGYAAFFGIGGYTSALLVIKLGISPWVGLLLGGIISALFSIIIGIPTLRLKGPYFAISTLAFAEIMRLIINNSVSITRGPLGLYGIPSLSINIIGYEISFSTEFNAYYLLLFLGVLIFILYYYILESPIGICFLSIREDEVAAEASGIDVTKFKILAFLISSFLAGIAGAFYAHYIGVITPDMLSLGVTFTVLLMTVVGGIGTIFGPIAGAFVLEILSESLRFIVGEEFRLLVYGIAGILVILLMPRGIVGSLTTQKRGAISINEFIKKIFKTYK